jgi:Predicted transcriptional regulators
MLIPKESSQTISHYNFSEVGWQELDVLAGLGLSGGQARVYLALLRVGNGRARTIANIASVNRQEVYHILQELQQTGLAKQSLTVPTTYSGMPITEGVELLLKQKTNELQLMTQRATRLTKKYGQINHTAPTESALTPCFGVVSEADLGKKYQKAIQQTQNTIEALTSWIRFKQFSFHFEANLKDALKKGLTVYVVTEKPLNHHLPKWVQAALTEYSNFKIKTTPEPPTLAATIFDHTQTAIAFNPNSRLTKGPALWTTHPALITPIQTYFNINWVQPNNKER